MSATGALSEHPVGDDALSGFTLPSRYYLDDAIFDEERRLIFYRNWHYAGHISQVRNPGDFVTARILDQSVFVMRGRDGVLRGFYNVCQHRGHELFSGTGNAKAIVCPYHAWSYHEDGRLRHARNADQVKGFEVSELCLKTIQVEVFCGFVFVNLDPDATPLASLAGDLAQDLEQRIDWLDDLAPVETSEFGGTSIDAGWKVVVDNYLECYHCTPAHPDFSDMVDMSAYKMDTFKHWSRQLAPKTRPDNSAYVFDPNTGMQTAAFWYLWPSTTFNVLPGKPSMFVLSIMPVSINSTTFVGHRYALDDTPDAGCTEYLNEVLGPEDKSLCESVQKGLSSRGYNQGRFMVDPLLSGTAEHAVHHFHRLVLDALGRNEV